MESTLFPLRLLKGLQKLHFLISGWNKSTDNSDLRPNTGGSFPGLKLLFSFRGLADIEIRNLLCEDMVNGIGGFDKFDTDTAGTITAVYRHLSQGLKLAQKGLVRKELYELEDWDTDELWPSAKNYDCGLFKGCSCGQTGYSGGLDSDVED